MYIALIRKDARSSYGVEFPDFPGCISGGDTLDAAMLGAGEALALHVRGMLEDGEEIPAPTSLMEVADSDACNGSVPTAVRLVPLRGKAIRLNITMEESLLLAVDEAAKQRGLTRSGFLAEAARQAL